MPAVMAPDSAVIDRQTDTFYCPVLGVTPDGYEVAREAEKDELDRERVRLWYVAATRARELLVLPPLDTTPSKSAWIGLVDLSLAELPGLAPLAIAPPGSCPAPAPSPRSWRSASRPSSATARACAKAARASSGPAACAEPFQPLPSPPCSRG